MRAFVVGVLLCVSSAASADIASPDAAVDAPGSGSGSNEKKNDDGCSVTGSSSGDSALWLAGCGAALVFIARKRKPART